MIREKYKVSNFCYQFSLVYLPALRADFQEFLSEMQYWKSNDIEIQWYPTDIIQTTINQKFPIILTLSVFEMFNRQTLKNNINTFYDFFKNIL